MNKNKSTLLFRLVQASPMLSAIEKETSFTKAAEKLAVQQSAVSHKVRAIEEALGISLFERTTRKLTLTHAGHVVCQTASESISLWSKALDRLEHLDVGAQVRLSMSSSLAMKWFIPLLSQNAANIDLSLHVSDQLVDFDQENIDAAVRFGIGPYPGLHAVRLAKCVLQPVVSPALVDNLESQSLLTDRIGEQDTTDISWSMYFSHASEVPFSGEHQRHDFDRSDLMLQAAINGMGIALGRTLLIEQDIQAGFLRKIGPEVHLDVGYWLICKPEFAQTKRYQNVYQWLNREMQTTIRCTTKEKDISQSSE